MKDDSDGNLIRRYSYLHLKAYSDDLLELIMKRTYHERRQP